MEKKFKFENLNISDLLDIQILQEKNVREINNVWTKHELINLKMKKNNFLRVSKYKKKIVGFSLFSYTQDLMDTLLIFVDPDFRRNGIAKRFLFDAEYFCREYSIKKIILEVNEFNTSALSLYNKLNFKKTGIKKNYYKFDGKNYNAIIMELNL